MKAVYTIILGISAMALIGTVAVGDAHVVHAVTILTTLPGQPASASGTSPGAFINAFYTWALSISGVLAFGIVVYGGVKYMLSTGNSSATSDAKEWIKAALFGILLLAGAYFILNIINPNLVNLSLPSLNSVTATTSNTNPSGGGAGNGSGGGGGNGSTTCNCASGTCGSLTTVCTGSNGAPYLPPGTKFQGGAGCPTKNACGADGGACAGDCPQQNQICEATGGTPINTSPPGSTLPWRCVSNTAYGK